MSDTTEENGGGTAEGVDTSGITIVETPVGVAPPVADAGFVADSPRHAEYEERIVAFVDVLGFKEIIKRSATEPELVRKVHHALDVRNNDWATVFAADVGLDMTAADFQDRLHSFSDFVVVSVRPDIREIGLMVYIIFKICRQLLVSGFLSRGGIAKGPLYHRDDSGKDAEAGPPMVFGPAFVEAYLFESSHADGPRVILQNKVREHILRKCSELPDTKLTSFLRTHVQRAADGPAFIDIFADFGPNEYYETAPDISSEVETIRAHICDALNRTADKPLYFKKNAQLARQFNAALEKAGREELMINGDQLPTREY
ncbi:hypothetical protein [Burkholderia thailandensis]|uniref:hypothetical protein n=1 Tax=Burkholderia thailandensis TaxID=57975 RepID=UPI001F01626E|nr:hypothetical protein [Burkholderia thailandensis]